MEESRYRKRWKSWNTGNAGKAGIPETLEKLEYRKRWKGLAVTRDHDSSRMVSRIVRRRAQGVRSLCGVFGFDDGIL